ncbi:MAG: Pathogenicity locus [Daejeonella sp.]|nr:Pathogenicity locus [Daejeonella sp.]
MEQKQAIKELMIIPGIGKSLANDLVNIGITSLQDLKGKDPDVLFDLSNQFAGTVQDRCVLYTFRCAIYYANTPPQLHDKEKLKWWNWKDDKLKVN